MERHWSEETVFERTDISEVPEPELRLVRDRLIRSGVVVRRAVCRWRLGAILVSSFALVSAVLALSFKHVYLSETMLLYREGINTAYVGGNQEHRYNSQQAGKSLEEFILSRIQLAKLVKEFKLHPDVVERSGIVAAVELVRKSIEFKIGKGDTFYIGYRGASPKEAAGVVSRLASMVIEHDTRTRKEQSAATVEFLDTERNRVAQELEPKEKSLTRFLARHPEFVFRPGQESAGGTAATLRTPESRRVNPELYALLRQVQRIDAQLAGNREPIKSATDPKLLAAKTEAEHDLAEVQRSLAAKRLQLTEMHPDVQTEKRRHEDAKGRLARINQLVKRAEHIESPQPAAFNRDELIEQRRVYREKIARLREGGASGSSRKEGAAIVALESKWAQLTRDINEAREKYTQLETRRFHAGLSASSMSSQIDIIDPAYVPKRPVGLGRSTVAGIGLAVGVALTVLILLALVAIDDRLYDRLDLGRLRLAPVLITVPRHEPRATSESVAGSSGEAGGKRKREGRAPAGASASPAAELEILAYPAVDPPVEVQSGAELRLHRGAPEGREQAQFSARGQRIEETVSETGVTRRTSTWLLDDPRLALVVDPASVRAASFRILRHRLFERGTPRTIVVTSAAPQEGKTTCAVNLAMALSEFERARVLLIETNLRAPGVASMLGIRGMVCFHDQLLHHRSHLGDPWVVEGTDGGTLDVLAVDPAGYKAPAVIDGRALELAFSQLTRVGYDFIVLDVPPVLGSADVNLIQDLADGVLFATWSGRSSATALRQAFEQLAPVKIIGVAMLEA